MEDLTRKAMGSQCLSRNLRHRRPRTALVFNVAGGWKLADIREEA